MVFTVLYVNPLILLHFDDLSLSTFVLDQAKIQMHLTLIGRAKFGENDCKNQKIKIWDLFFNDFYTKSIFYPIFS